MRQLLRDAGHLVRLAILFVIGATVLLVVRAVAVPEDFGRLGHFRASALDEARERPLQYAGRVVCADCHDEAAVALAGGGHAGVGCEACHGPLAAHAADPDAAAPAAVASCERCHAALLARPTGHPQVDVEPHAEGNACTDCHVAHAPGME
jgi:hypothetical protein